MIILTIEHINALVSRFAVVSRIWWKNNQPMSTSASTFKH